MAASTRTSHRAPLVVLLVVAMLAGVSAAVCQVWTRLRVIDLGYRISEAAREHGKLVEANRRLRLEHALLKSPDRISSVARGTLGLRPPVPEQVRRIRAREPHVPAPRLATRER